MKCTWGGNEFYSYAPPTTLFQCYFDLTITPFSMHVWIYLAFFTSRSFYYHRNIGLQGVIDLSIRTRMPFSASLSPKCIPFFNILLCQRFNNFHSLSPYDLILFSNPDYNLIQGTGILTVQKLFCDFCSDVHSFSIVLAITHETGRCCKYYRNVKIQNVFKYSNIWIKYFSKAVQ